VSGWLGAVLLAGAALGLPPLPAPRPAQVALGQALFFERGLSVNGTLSCAMCHVPEQGFTHNELATSVGMEGVSLRRNAPTLLNVAHVRPLFHDGRAATLEQQALMPLLHPQEMAQPSRRALLATLRRLLRQDPVLRARWLAAHGAAPASTARLAQALAAYQRSLLAGDSAYDRWRFGGDPQALSLQQQRGHALFQSKGCVRCHRVGTQDALFTDQGFHNVGVAARSQAARLQPVVVDLAPGQRTQFTPQQRARVGEPVPPDEGRHELSGRPEDRRAFRTPSLRNVALTAPYMHDGSLPTLDAVLDHYAAGGWPADAAQSPLIRPLVLSTDERAALLAFLRALSASTLPQRPQDYR
jgi:cytochrome c peroxidase